MSQGETTTQYFARRAEMERAAAAAAADAIARDIHLTLAQHYFRRAAATANGVSAHPA